MRTALSVVAAIVGAAIGAVVGFVVSLMLWVVFVEGGPEAPIGALARIVYVAVPTGLVVGGVVGWSLSRERRA